ncbi:MAG: hypothetical protein JXA54_05815 [Candidatus Heimdallarchaeota archaeon]|nr:hypothetical protein [Candidatus Heimdallarchaeota archaeon]
MVSKEISNEKTTLAEDDIKKLIRFKLEKKIAQLPYGFWRCDKGKEHSRVAIRYLIEEHMNLKLEEIPMSISAKTFHDAGLFRILVEFFDSSYYKALDYVYPGKFKPWQFSKGMTGIWNGEDGIKRSLEAISYIIKNLNIAEEDIPRKITYQVFKDFGLGGMLQTLYCSSPYQAINALYSNKFKPWEFSVKNFWKNVDISTAQEATRWLVEEKLKLTTKELIKVRRKHFLEYNLGQMLKEFYQNSHLTALEDVYDF